MPSEITEPLKPGYENYPCFVTPNGFIYVQLHGKLTPKKQEDMLEFISLIAEPNSRLEYLHRYRLTSFSMLSAVSHFSNPSKILVILSEYAKHPLPPSIIEFISGCIATYGKVSILYEDGHVYLESTDVDVLRTLLKNQIIRGARVMDEEYAPKPLKETGHPYSEVGYEEDEDDDRVKRKKLTTRVCIEPKRVGVIKGEVMKMDVPIFEQYEYAEDPSLPNLGIQLNGNAKLRWYQEKAMGRMLRGQRARSGVVVLPCGAGKTLTGISTTCSINKPTLILCNNNLACKQWMDAFFHFSTATRDKVMCFSSENIPNIPKDGSAILLFATYSMFSVKEDKRSVQSLQVMKKIAAIEWGLVVLDEVHIAPAEEFRKAIYGVRSRCKLGLTATMVREDGQVGDLNFLVGPKLYEANWMELTSQGYLARVQCIEVPCPMSFESMTRYISHEKTRDKQEFYYTTNTNKIAACEALVRMHEERKDQILVFSDSVPLLLYCAKRMDREKMYGKTSEAERTELFAMFKAKKIQTLLISRIGDVAVDLPDANVIIQISSHYASRRQETQRLGRILRPKGRTEDKDGNPMFNATFYTLISSNTKEMEYSLKRQRHLNDQGYAYRTVEFHTIVACEPGMDAHTDAEQITMLNAIKKL